MGIKKEELVLVVDPKAQAAERLLKRLGVAIKTFGLYPRQHSVATRALEGPLVAIRPYLESFGPFVARISKQSFAIDGIAFEGETFGTGQESPSLSVGQFRHGPSYWTIPNRLSCWVIFRK